MPTKMRNQLLHPSGGLVWHLRAWQNHQNWQPLKKALSEWLNDWIDTFPPQQKSLVLVGPSAGWTLPLDQLKRFTHISVFEPDILARQLLKLRLRHTRLQIDSVDIFAPDGLEYLRTHYADHAILFCNVLGQLSPDDPTLAESWCQSIMQTLNAHHWASYHDLISTQQAPFQTQTHHKFPPDTSIENILSAFWRESEIEICDHQTHWFTQTHSFACIPWQLRKSQWHLVQWLSHSAHKLP